jgi:hypothetical protein
MREKSTPHTRASTIALDSKKQLWRPSLKDHHVRINSRTAVDAFNNGTATVINIMKNNTASWAKC